MKANLTLLVLVFAGLFADVQSHAADAGAPLRVVPSVDFARYEGKWYEIARLPAWFQKDCVSDTTATYTRRPDGKITVLNQCRKADDQMKSATGTAKVAGEKGPNTKLKVTFFWPFYGDYWIIDLDPDYQWVVIGEPQGRYFWILSRSPQIAPALYNQLLEHARAQGYDLSRLIVTRQGH
jgi:apolipoprotein D and lipocalin family protein